MGYSGYQTLKSSSLWLSLTILLLLPLMLVADDEKTAEPDCGQADIRYRDDPSLSRAERIVLMEKAFYDSINRFEACELANQSASSSANNSGGGSGDDGDGAQSDGLSEKSATASQDMQGTDPALEIPPPMAEQALQDSESGTTQSPASARNGAIPEDIPAANNDDAIAAQIRLAAESETDPEIREKLWNEYRKYKGLKVVE
ncbi:MAG TPA: hypothetical protein VK999_02365 [Methylotenera sp.]|nr:hypothetical protein [Methylotenera sp.]